MSFREILDSFRQGKSSARSHIKNLIEMASVDGSYAKEEDELLLSIAARNGISSRRIQEIRENPERVSFEVPKQEGEKFRQIYDLVHMMVIDNDIHPEEVRLSELFASKFGYPKPMITGIITTIKQNIENGNGVQETHDRVLYFLKFKQGF